MTKPDYDYIIVGAGTARCVLAARLTEDTRCPGAADKGGRRGADPGHDRAGCLA